MIDLQEVLETYAAGVGCGILYLLSLMWSAP